MRALGIGHGIAFAGEASGAGILAELGAVFAIDAADSIPGEQWALNRGAAGQVLRARYGSVARAELRRGVGLILPGTAGNTAKLPSSAGIDTAGNFELMFEGSLDLEASNNQHLIVRDDQSTNRNWYLTMGAARTPQLVWWASDGSIRAMQATTAMALTSGQIFAVKAELIHDDGLGNTIGRFYSAPSAAGPWSQLGADVIGNYVAPRNLRTGLNAAVAFLVQNSISGGAPTTGGVVRRAWMKAGINGPALFDVDFTAVTDLASSFPALTGQTISLDQTAAVDTNDPFRAAWSGENYFYQPGGSTQFDNVTSAAITIGASNVLHLTADYTPDLWAGAGAEQTLLSYTTGDPNRSVRWTLINTGQMAVGIVPTGSVAGGVVIPTSSVPVPFGPGQRGRCAVTIEGNVAGSYRVRFFTAPAGTNDWSQLGTDQTGPGFTLASTTSPWGTVGANAVAGRLHRVTLATGIGAAPLLDIDASVLTSANQNAFQALTGQTCQIIRSPSGRKGMVVTRPLWLLGPDDQLDVLDNDLLDFANGQDATFVVVARSHNPAHTGYVMSKKQDGVATAGWAFGLNAGSMLSTFADGSTQTTITANPAFVSGSLMVMATRITADSANNTVNGAGVNSLSLATIGSLASSTLMRIGNLGGNQLGGDFELAAAAVFRRSLTSAELARIVAFYGAT